jgi:hypothetical protein
MRANRGSVDLCRSLGSSGLEALAAEYRTPLRGAERNGSLLAASRARGLGFHFGVAVGLPGHGRRAQHRNALGLTALATLGFVLKLFIVEKKLFPSREDELAPAINTLEHLVLKFH